MIDTPLGALSVGGQMERANQLHGTQVPEFFVAC
jgi:hypothetical protein